MEDGIYISQVGCKNFKSYRDEEDFTLKRGINCIIGENGQGKSNLIDCILLSLGAKDDRVRKNKDLIYRQGEESNQKAITQVKVTACEAPQDLERIPNRSQNLQEVTGDIVKLRTEIFAEDSAPIKYFLNNRHATLKKIGEFFQRHNINIKKPKFVVTQGNVTKLASLTNVAINNFINERFGFTQDWQPAVEIPKELVHIREMRRFFGGDSMNRIIEEQFRQLKYLENQQSFFKNKDYFNTLQRNYLIFDYYRKYYDELANEQKELKIKKKLPPREEELAKFKKELRQNQQFERGVEHEIEDQERAIYQQNQNLTSKVELQMEAAREEDQSDGNEIKKLTEEIQKLEEAILKRDQEYKEKQRELENYMYQIDKGTAKIQDYEKQIKNQKVYQKQLQKGRPQRDMILQELEKKEKSREMTLQQYQYLKRRKGQTEQELKQRKKEYERVRENLEEEQDKLESENEITMSQNVISQREVIVNQQTKKRKELLHAESELEGTQQEMNGYHILKVRSHHSLNRSRVFGFMHQLFQVKEEGKPWVPALSNFLGGVLFNVVLADGQTSRAIGNIDGLLVNAPRNTWFVQEDRIAARDPPRDAINKMFDKFEGRVLFAQDCIIPQNKARRSVNNIFRSLFLCETNQDAVQANQFAFKNFKWRIATLSRCGSSMTEDGLVRYKKVNTKKPLFLCMAQKRIELLNKCDTLKWQLREIDEKLSQTTNQATQAEDKL